MDLKISGVQPDAEEKDAIDALLGLPDSPWTGASRGDADSLSWAHGGREQRERRHLLLPALVALQARMGWLSEGGLNYICTRLGVPPADAWGVATFYALLSTTPRPRRVLHVCEDLACQARGVQALIAALEQDPAALHLGSRSTTNRHGPHGTAHPMGAAQHGSSSGKASSPGASAGWTVSPCLGMCDQAPAAYLTEAGRAPRDLSVGSLTREGALALLEAGASRRPDEATDPPLPQRGAGSLRLLARAGVVDPGSLEAYRAARGFEAFERALAMGPDAVIQALTDAGLVGRGGAVFPTGRKWQAVRSEPALPHYLVCNADESEPGTFKDRLLLTHDPFAIVEAMGIAAFATRVTRGYVYLRGEYPLARARLGHAIEQARTAGYLGRNVCGAGFDFDVEIRTGAGAYICGEETAIFESIEGKRGEPRNKPPFPVQVGLFGKPTLVNNVETLANVPLILRDGVKSYRSVGTEASPGTRLFCLSGNVARPGVYEFPLGLPLREVIEAAGPPARIAAVLLGGAAGTLLSPEELDLPLSHEGARAAGHSLGSGVVMVLDENQELAKVLERVAAFFRDESCGQCVPCRVGTVRQEEALARLCASRDPVRRATDLALIGEIGMAMRDGSICGLGQTASSVIESALKRFTQFGADGGSVQ